MAIKPIELITLKQINSGKILSQDADGDKRDVTVWDGTNPVDSQQWYLIPAQVKENDSDFGYYIVNKKTGFFLCPGRMGVDPNDRLVFAWPIGPAEDHPKGLLWDLKKNGQYYHLKNLENNQALTVAAGGTDPGQKRVTTWPDEANDPQYNWEIDTKKELAIPNAPNLTDIGASRMELERKVKKGLIQGTGDTVDIGVLDTRFVNCIFVHDWKDVGGNEKSLEWKLKNSPYYILERHAKWHLENQLRNSTDSEQNSTVVVETNWSEETAAGFAATVGGKISAGLEGLGTAEVSWSFTTSFTRTLGKGGKKSVTVNLNAKPGNTAYAFSQKDKLVLKRKDGEKVMEWDLGSPSGNNNAIFAVPNS